jgi:hypothetical protein
VELGLTGRQAIVTGGSFMCHVLVTDRRTLATSVLPVTARRRPPTSRLVSDSARTLSVITGTHLAFRAGLDRALPWLSRAADPELRPRGILELTGGTA